MDLKKFLAKLIFLGIHKELPGFIVLSYDFKRVKIFERDIVLPEDFFVDLERYNNSTRWSFTLYKVSKTFSWNYWPLVKVEPVSNFSDLKKYLDDFKYYITISFASDMYYSEKDLLQNPPLVKLTIKDWIICRKTGLGYINNGLVAGIGFALGDKTVEATQIKCQGRGDRECVVVAGSPRDILAEYPSAKIMKFCEVEEYNINEIRYRILNKVRKVSNPFSFSQIKKREKGMLTYGGKRYFYIETTFLHLLEREIEGEIIYELAKKVGASLVKNHLKSPQQICNLISAFGFGEVNYQKIAGEEVVRIYHYPYSCCLKNFDFPYVCGLLSGAFSTLFNKDINFRVEKHEITDTLFLLLKAVSS